MMEKRYQVFISSTFTDLAVERKKVVQTVMEMDCIPSGMETFPAIDEEQFKFITRVIDDCDYYILIIGARYGSTNNEGISYTEKEYEYALEKKINILAFVHQSPGDISFDKSEQDPELRTKLESFRKKVSTGRMVRFWNSADELQGQVATSLSRTIKLYPAVGWVRSTYASNTEILNELNEQRKLNTELNERIAELEKKLAVVREVDEPVNLNKEITLQIVDSHDTYGVPTTWEKLFYLLSPLLLEYPSDHNLKISLTKAIKEYFSISGMYRNLDSDQFQTIKIQFESLGLIKSTYGKTTKGGTGLFWSLSKKGRKVMADLRTASLS